MVLAGQRRCNAHTVALLVQEGGGRHAGVLVGQQKSWWQWQGGGRWAKTTINLGCGGLAAALTGPRWHNTLTAVLLGQEGGSGRAAVLVGRRQVLVAVRDEGGRGCAVVLLGWRTMADDGGRDVVALAILRAGVVWRNESRLGKEEDTVLAADGHR
jgi:hypothetical protein